MKLVLIILSHLVYIFDKEYCTMPTLTISNTRKRNGNEEVTLALKRARREVISDLATKIINGDKKAMAKVTRTFQKFKIFNTRKLTIFRVLLRTLLLSKV